MNQDFGALLKENPTRFRFIGIKSALMEYLTLHLVVQLDQFPRQGWPGQLSEISCSNAVDYSIRPRNPNCLMGGPFVELHEEHELLRRGPSQWPLQCVPGGDGEVFVPPIKFSVLLLEQSYVIAEKFMLRDF